MIGRILLSLLSCWALNVTASPVLFTSSQYETSAVALTETMADANSDSSQSSPLPLVTSATVFGPNDFASGNGVAADALLFTLAEASSDSGTASAVGTSRFLGTFSGGGLLGIALDFASNDATDPSNFSMGSLALLIMSGGSILLDEVITTSGLFEHTLRLPFGLNHTLDLLLSSEASVVGGGQAFNDASVSFQLSLIPEPATWLMLLAGLLLLGVGHTQRR